MKPCLSIFLAGCCLALPGVAAVPAADGGPQAAKASAGEPVTCSREWRRKRIVRWERHHGRKRRVVTHRWVRVRICEPASPAPSRLGVKAWEFGFTLSASQVPAGDTIVELNNRGEDSHDLHIQPAGGGIEMSTEETSPGTVNRIRLITSPGSYRLWCSLPGHAARGMDTTFEATPQTG